MTMQKIMKVISSSLGKFLNGTIVCDDPSNIRNMFVIGDVVSCPKMSLLAPLDNRFPANMNKVPIK